MTKGRLVAAGVAVACVTLGLAFAAGEAAVRYRERHRITVPGTMPTLYYRHSRLRHALTRDFSYLGWAYVDSSGFRRSAPAPLPGGKPVVLIVGASTVFDTQVSSDDHAWPAQLESILRQDQRPFAGDIVNGAVVAVAEGVANAGSQWVLRAQASISLGRTPLVFWRAV